MRWAGTVGLLLGVAACASADHSQAPSVDAAAAPVDTALPAFVLEATTSLVPGPGLALRTNLPARDLECRELPVRDAPCGDVDGDLLTDAWEDLVLDRMRPMLRLDEDEPIVTDGGTISAVGRVALRTGGAALDVVMFVMNGYAQDYGSCGASAHHGDSERVGLRLRGIAGGGPGDVEVVAAYTAAHEYTANDRGKVFSEQGLSQLVFAFDPTTQQPRWVVFPSEAKHATYATIAECEGAVPFPCLTEDCAPDGVADATLFDRLPPVVNAGEDNARRIDALDAHGFAGETAWGEHSFCGGMGGTGCSASVREKLLSDPFQ
ncbi:MAG: hypothetical protein AB7O24_11060 [Kofleriaceae bacterium]